MTAKDLAAMGLEPYQVDLEKIPRHRWKSFISHLTPRREAVSLFKDIGLFAGVLLLLNVPIAVMGGFYVVGSAYPFTTTAHTLVNTYGGYFAYAFFLIFISIVVTIVNFILLLLFVKAFTRSVIHAFLALILASIPAWGPFVVEAALRLYLSNVECDGFDGTVFLAAVHYHRAGMSYAQFPDSMGGEIWQVYQLEQGISRFSPISGDSEVTFDLRNDTYSIQYNGTSGGGLILDGKGWISFPELGLYYDGDWIRPCFSPTASFKNSSGGEIVKTGLSAYTDCARMKVCVNWSMGMEGIFVVVGRILMALAAAAQCCTQSRYD